MSQYVVFRMLFNLVHNQRIHNSTHHNCGYIPIEPNKNIPNIAKNVDCVTRIEALNIRMVDGRRLLLAKNSCTAQTKRKSVTELVHLDHKSRWYG